MTDEQCAKYRAMQDMWCRCKDQNPDDQRYYEYKNGSHGWKLW